MPTALTVTATQGGGTSAGMLLRVKVLTGAALAQTEATVASSTALNGTITTTVTGSIVYGALSGDAAAGAFSAEPLCTLTDNFHDTSNGEYYGSFRTTSATGTPGSTLVGSTTANANRNLAAAEILPNGTIAEDASAPAVATTMTATAVTTASFTPPAGSLLVAIVPSDGAAGGTLTTMTVSGGGLTWTELVHAASASTCYAGVWVAQVPAGGAATASGALSISGSAAGQAPATAAAAVTLAGTAAGKAPVTAGGAVSVSGSAAAAAPVSPAGTVTFAGAASATGPGVTAAGALAVTGTASGAAPAPAAGSVTVAGTAAAAAPAPATGSLALTGTASATAPSAATAAVVLSGSATARATAAAAAALALSGAATASAQAAAAGTAVFSGTAAASGPGVTASAAMALAGTAAAKAPAAAIGALSVAGTAAPRAAAGAAGTVTITGTALFLPPFTVGTLTASDRPAGVLASAAAIAPQGTLTASDTRTGGPGG